jgi:hypothetical protein
MRKVRAGVRAMKNPATAERSTNSYAIVNTFGENSRLQT